MKRILRIAFFIALGALFIYTIWFLYKKSEQKPVVFKTTQAFKTDIVKKTVATGAVVPRREVNIKPQVSGIIEKLYVIAGDRIRKGDMIAQIRIIPNMINLANAESRLNRAKLAYDNAKVDYERNQKLLDAKMIAYADFQQVKLSFNNAK